MEPSLMEPTLKDKVAFVVAASEGLGFATAARLAEAGCAVAICGRRQEGVDKAGIELRRRGLGPVVAEVADLTRPEDLERLVATVRERLGGLDILVVNSGHIPYGGLEDFSDRDWYDAFDLLLMSAVRLVRLALPLMRARGGGDIIFIGSATVREPSPQLLLSSVMRLGVAGLAKTLARNLAGENIRVNMVSPGYFDTGRVHRRIDELAATEQIPREEAAAQFAKDIPSRRIGEAKELAEIITFVASRRASFMTGAAITVDGGAGRAIL
jgi:3-oxoacyl-[acyl-carrier protein] reductase